MTNSNPHFERRHFNWIAEVIRDYGYPMEQDRLAKHFTARLRTTNPNFNERRFLEACGVKD